MCLGTNVAHEDVLVSVVLVVLAGRAAASRLAGKLVEYLVDLATFGLGHLEHDEQETHGHYDQKDDEYVAADELVQIRKEQREYQVGSPVGEPSKFIIFIKSV